MDEALVFLSCHELLPKRVSGHSQSQICKFLKHEVHTTARRLTGSQISNIRKPKNSIPLRLIEISVWVLIFMDAWTLNFTVTPVRTATLHFIGAEKAWTIFTSQRCLMFAWL